MIEPKIFDQPDRCSDTNVTGPEPRFDKPNLFLIGAPKCGTTSLYDYLVRYPNIAGGLHKEPHFFCDDFDSIRKARTLPDYLSFFENDRNTTEYVIDASTCYFYSQTAIENIVKFCPNAKIIVMLRNPIDLIRSLHDHLRFRQIEPVADLQAAWHLGRIEERVPGFAKVAPYPGDLSYKLAGQLGRNLKSVANTVAQQNLLVLFFDDLVCDRMAVLRQVLDFLSMTMEESLLLEKRNQAKQTRSPVINRLLMYPPRHLQLVKSGIKRLLSDETVRKLDLFSRINRSPAKTSRISDSFREEVADYFSNDVRLLARLTGRDLDHWLDHPLLH